jgi:hypothetical protein
MEKDLILKIKIIENISIKKWNIWKPRIIPKTRRLEPIKYLSPESYT